VRLNEFNTGQWKRVCDVASLLLDIPARDRDAILDRECGADAELREAVLHVCRNYSDSPDLFGAPPLALAAMDDARVGQQIGAWRILRLLGEGGMGRVYLVERADDVFAKHAALKLIRGYCDSTMAMRFQTERRILALLDHPAVARALDGGATRDGEPYLVMEYVDGKPIDEFCQRLSVRAKVQLFLQVVDAIDVAHRNLVVHRDLKPSNILVTPDGQAKILDFGIAKLLDEEGSLEHTRTGMQALTPSYASPEQLLQEPVATFSDIYSLGAVLYMILTGHPPHELAGLNALESIRAVTESSPAPPSRHANHLAGDLDSILLKALERNPARRYASAAELAGDLRRFLEGRAVLARRATVRYRAGKFVRRNRLGIAVACGIVAIVAVTTLTALRQGRLAQRRFEDVRGLAHSVMFEYEGRLSKLPGSTELREQIAADTVRYLDSVFQDAGDDPQLEREIASGYRKIGEIAGYTRVPNLGKLSAAEASLQKSVSLWKVLVKRQDGSVDDRLELIAALARLATVKTDEGRLVEAGALLEEGMRGLDALPAAAANRPALHQERVETYFAASRLAQRNGDGKRAIEYARRTVRESEQLPPRPLDPQGIAISLMQLALCDDDYGLADPKLTQEAIDKARTAVRLVREAPGCREISCRETAATVLTRASVVLYEKGLVDDALALTEAVEVLEELLREDPGNLGVLSTLRLAVTNRSNVLQKVGRLQESLRASYRQLEVAELMSARDPSQPELLLNVGSAASEIGAGLMTLHRFREATPFVDRATAIVDRPASQNVNWLIFQNYAHELKSELEEHAGDLPAAREEIRKSMTAAEIYLERAPGHPFAMVLEANAHFRLGKALRSVNTDQACTLLQQSLDRYRELQGLGNPIQDQWKGNVPLAEAAYRGCR